MINWNNALIAKHKDGRKQTVFLKSGVKQPNKDGKYTVIGLPDQWKSFNEQGINGSRNCGWTITNDEIPVIEGKSKPSESFYKIRKLRGLRLRPVFKSDSNKSSLFPEPTRYISNQEERTSSDTLLAAESSFSKNKDKFKIGDRVYYIPRPSWRGKITNINYNDRGIPGHFVLFDDFDSRDIYIRTDELDYESNCPINVSQENHDLVQMSEAIITKAHDDNAWGIRKDTSEDIYFPRSIQEVMDFQEFDEVKVVMVLNNRPSPKWKAIKARPL